MEQAIRDVVLGSALPYDGNTPADKYEAAACGILHNMLDRRGIKWEFEAVDEDVRPDIMQTIATTIKAAIENDLPIFETYDEAYEWLKSQDT